MTLRRRRVPLPGALMLAAALAAPPATAADAPDSRGCAVLWQVTPVLVPTAADGPHLQVALRFVGGPQPQTALHLPGGWAALTETGGAPRLREVPGEPTWRSIAHAPGETVQLQWRLQPAAGGAAAGTALLAAGWFAFGGQGVLPMPEGADAPDAGPACVLLQGGRADDRWASSHGHAEGPSVLWRLAAGGVPLAQRVQQSLYAGGALQVQALPGLLAAMPQPAPWPVDVATLAAAGSRALAAQSRQWPLPATADAAASAAGPAGRGAAPPWLLLALPAPAADTTLAGAWHQALALQLPPAWLGAEADLQRLLAPALARAWLADRFGPLAHAGRGDGALRAWFSEGWADFLAHRALLRDGLWTPETFAAEMNARAAAYLADPARSLPNIELAAASLQSVAAARMQALRGEWLAFAWHQALRRAGQPGLEAALRLQLVPAAQARREGPISAPLATHRVLATLRGVLQDQPLRDLQQHIDQGLPFDLGPDALGPCFNGAAAAAGAAARWQPVPGALQQADCQGWLGLGPLVDMQPVRLARAAANGATAGASSGDCTPVRSARAKAGKAARAAARQAQRCQTVAAAAPAGSRGVAKPTGKKAKGAKAGARAAGKPAAKAAAKAGTQGQSSRR